MTIFLNNVFCRQATTLVLAVVLLAGLVWPTAQAKKAEQQAECSVLKGALTESWQGYKDNYIQADGRVRDPFAQDISTSESQAYGMLRAVWMNDRASFDSIYQWARNNLRVRNDKLMAWKWGKKGTPEEETVAASNNQDVNNPGANTEWGVLDETSASDADEDMALALILAHQRWGNAAYQTDAQHILNDIWDKQVADTKYFGHVMLPGDFKHEEDFWLINPSYFWPLAYRVFAEVDPKHAHGHDWEALIDSTYDILDESVHKSRTGLPPNWLKVAKSSAPKDKRVDLFWEVDNERSDYGYDAIRTHWRVGMDYMLTGSSEAKDILYATNFLERYWWIRRALPSPLSIDGVLRVFPNDVPPSHAIYGATLPHLMLAYPTIGHAIVNDYILTPLDNGIWQPKFDYYAQNWLWLGLWTYTGQHCGSEKLRQSRSLRDNLLHWVDWKN